MKLSFAKALLRALDEGRNRFTFEGGAYLTVRALNDWTLERYASFKRSDFNWSLPNPKVRIDCATVQEARRYVLERLNVRFDGRLNPDLDEDEQPSFNLQHCDHCGVIEWRSNMSSAEGGTLICPSCVESYQPCAHCEIYYRPEHMLAFQGENYCEAHYRRAVMRAQERAGGGLKTLADFAIDGITCLLPRSEYVVPARGLGGLCGYSTRIPDHVPSFLVANNERGVSLNSLFLGVELETVPRDSVRSGIALANAWRDVERFGLIKSDSSIASGFEIVSAPATLAAHRILWADFFNREKGAYKGLSGWNESTCGIHIHVSRKALSSLSQGRLLAFMTAPENQDFLLAISGRRSNNYCMKGPRKSIQDYRIESSFGRYQALNFDTSGHHTIEFRLFQSNVAPHGFMRILEFVDALCNWIKDASNERLNANDFCQWVAANRGAWRVFAAWLEGKGFIAARHKQKEDFAECA